MSNARIGPEPRWRGDGKELFYLEVLTARRVGLFAVPIGAGSSPVGTATLLFELPTFTTSPLRNVFVHSPSADGQRFLVDTFAGDADATLELILNWAGHHR